MTAELWAPSQVLSATCWGLFLEAVLYGIYAILVLFSLHVHYRHSRVRTDRRAYRTSRILIALALMLFALITAHWVMAFVRFYHGIVSHGATAVGAAQYFTDFSLPLWTSQVAVYSFAHLVMDALLVARLSAFWNWKLWITIPPLITVIGESIAYSMMCFYEMRFSGFNTKAFELQDKWTTAAYSLTCFTNIFSTSFIIYRVTMKDRALREFNLRTSVAPIMALVIESAALYSVFNIVLFILFNLRHSAAIIAFALAAPLTGIVYSLITIQIGKGFTFLRPPQFDEGAPGPDELRTWDGGTTARNTPRLSSYSKPKDSVAMREVV